MTEPTFGLTTTNADHSTNKYGIEAWHRVGEEYRQLKMVVGSLSEKVSNVLEKQERDFLAAYRAHMYNVQKELQDLRNKVAKAETSLQKNDKVHKLEGERSWYRKEALRLDSFTSAMKKDLKYMKEKLESIEDDRNWLERQLKAAKKQNKLLRAELEIRLSSNAGQPQSHGDTMGMGDSMTSPGMFPLVTSTSQERMGQPMGMQKGFARTAPAASMEEDVERGYQKEIRDLKKQLAASKRENGKLRASQVSQQTNKATLEEFFLRSIESVKRDIGRRRKKAAMQRAGMSSNLGDPRSDMSMSGLDGDKGNSTNALEQFTSTDRARVIERLLAQDEVLAFLYDHLFPAQGPSAGGMGGDSMQQLQQQASQQGMMARQAGPANPGYAVGSGAAAALGKKGGLPLNSDTLDFLNKRPESSLL